MKPLLLLVPGLLLAGGAHAQFGLRAGANYASLSESGPRNARYAGTDGRVGYQIGAFYEKKVSAQFSLVPEVHFSRQRISLDATDFEPAAAIGRATYRVGLSYLNVPVLARLYIHKFYLELGLQGSYLLSAREVGTQDRNFLLSSYYDPASVTSFDRRATDRYQRFDFGAPVGFGVRLPTGFELGLRTYAGLLSVSKGARSTYRGELNNVVIQANVAYRFSH